MCHGSVVTVVSGHSGQWPQWLVVAVVTLVHPQWSVSVCQCVSVLLHQSESWYINTADRKSDFIDQLLLNMFSLRCCDAGNGSKSQKTTMDQKEMKGQVSVVSGRYISLKLSVSQWSGQYVSGQRPVLSISVVSGQRSVISVSAWRKAIWDDSTDRLP